MTKKATKVKAKKMVLSAEEFANKMEFRVRDYCRHGESNDKLVTIKAPGTDESDKQALISFVKRTGLKNVPQGAERKRYFLGNCHWMVVFKRKDFEKAKATGFECPDCGDWRSSMEIGSECESCGHVEPDPSEMDEETEDEQQSVPERERPPMPERSGQERKEAMDRVLTAAEELVGALRQLKGMVA